MQSPPTDTSSRSNDLASSRSIHTAAMAVGAGAKFPLSDGHFPPIQLSPLEIVNYELQMDEIVQNALKECDLHDEKGNFPIYPAPWTALAQVGDLAVVQRRSAHAPTRMKSRVFGRIDGDCRQFLDFYYTDTSRELLNWHQFVFGCAVDAAVLCNIHTKHEGKKHLYMGIKWVVLQPSSMRRKRDLCFLEYMTYTTDLQGRDVAVRVQFPLRIPECPAFDHSMKVKRIPSRMVSIVRPVLEENPSTGRPDQRAQVFILCESAADDFFASGGFFKKVMNALKDMRVQADLKRIWSKGMVSKSNWVPKASRKSCSICHTNFHAARRRHHCRLCGDVICRSCVILRDAPKHTGKMGSSKQKPVKVVKTKFCMICVSKVRNPSIDVTQVRARPAPSIIHVTASEEPVKEETPEQMIEEEDDGYGSSNSSLWSATDSIGSLSDLSEQRSSSLYSWTDNTTEKVSFVNKLDIIPDDDNITATMNQNDDLAVMLEDTAMLEVSEVIDTTDMVPLKFTNKKKNDGQRSKGSFSSLREDDYEFYSPSQRRRQQRASVDTSPLSSSRSIDQCLAEQEELLRRMVFASSTIGKQQRAAAAASAANAPSMIDLPKMARQRTQERVAVKLYEP